MGTILFDPTAFRALFPAFSDANTYPDSVLQLFWDTATAYVSDQNGGCYILKMSLKQQTLAINLMAAHLAQLNFEISSGTAPAGAVTSSTIDKVSVSISIPPSNNSWQFWLNKTPYGLQLLALLQLAAVGGAYYGGFPSVVLGR